MKADTIALVAFDGISPFHLSVPALFFGEDHTGIGIPKHKLLVCAEHRDGIATTGGYSINVPHGLDAIARAGTVILPSWHNPDQRPSEALLAALRRAHARGAQMVGLCLGAFVLAEAGILDGRRATTHWLWAEAFAQRYPAISVDPGVLYLDDGNVLTSAGTAAAIDCCLHLIRSRHGAQVANRMARRLVVAPHRAGGQAQYIEQPLPANPGEDRLSAVLAWGAANLEQPMDVDTLAERALLSRRTFTRRFREATGTTVVKWLSHQRLAAAQRLLETTDLPLEQVAARSGFGSALVLRQHFARTLHTSPSAYRGDFQARGVEPIGPKSM